MRTRNDDIDEIIKEVNRRYKFDKEFDIGLISNYDNNQDSCSSEQVNEEWSHILLVVTLSLHEYDWQVVNLLWFVSKEHRGNNLKLNRIKVSNIS